MRMLFNHGLTASELYSNTPKSVVDRKWAWFRERYGTSTSYEDAIADPFKYCLGLIFNYILDNKVRFIIPGVPESYIDFEIVTGDMFIEQRQNGRFGQIDFIESDFTGYALRYYFKTKAYQKAYPIYFGGQLKQKFIDGINSGVKYYTIKDVTMADFLPMVCEKFSDLTNIEVKKMLAHGFRRMHSAIKYGCAISIQTQKNINCVAHIGAIYLKPDKQIKEYSVRKDKKLRKIEGWKKTPFDNYYYIGLNDVAFEKWIKLNSKSRTVLQFTNIIPRKIKEEIYYKAKHLYVFRFKREDFKGWSYWAENLKLRNIEYIGEVLDRKFTPSSLTWKNLIKEYETRSS